MKVKLIIAAVIVLAVAVWAYSSFTDSLTSYVSIAEAKSRPERVQVMGAIDHNLVEYNPDTRQMIFPISDDNGNILEVIYTGAVPGNFDQATHVVCLGRYDGAKFQADQLLVKCPSKYQGEEG